MYWLFCTTILVFILLITICLTSQTNFENFESNITMWLLLLWILFFTMIVMCTCKRERTFKQFFNSYKLIHGNKNDELAEQIVLYKHIEPSDQVLEFGPNVGRSSIIINSRLKNKKNHVVVEADPSAVTKLKENRDANGQKFRIFSGAISDTPLYRRGWKTGVDRRLGEKVNTLSLSSFLNKYSDVQFNTIVADCEGCLIPFFKKNDSFLRNIRKVIIEHDFESANDLSYFIQKMRQNGLVKVDEYLKTDTHGPGPNWIDGLKSDPIFVSVWKK